MSNALMSIFYDRKYILTGNIVEVIEYERPILKRLGERAEGSNSGRSVDASEVDQERHRKDTLQRARAKVRRLINTNAYQWFDEKGKAYKPVFLTLTYADNMTDVSQGSKDLRGFIKRLSYMVHGGQEGRLKYLAVPEFQERGAVHYHLVIFNLPYTDKELIASRWVHGFIDIRSIDQVTNVGAYISKYMTKTEDERLKGRRCFLSSQGLHEPVEIKCRSGTQKAKEIENGVGSLPLKYESSFQTDYYGLITYKQYSTKRGETHQPGVVPRERLPYCESMRP